MTRYYYLFPFGRVPCGSKVVLYGYGEAAKWYLAQLRQTGYAKLVAVTGITLGSANDLSAKTILPDSIKNLHFDYVLIAMESTEAVEKAEEMLVNKYCVPVEKIVMGSGIPCEMPILFKAQNHEIYKEGTIPMAVWMGGGMGDTVMFKRKLDEVMAWDSRIVLDCYVKKEMLPAMHSFFDGEYDGRIKSIIGGTPSDCVSRKEYYAFVFNLTWSVDFDVYHVDEKKLMAYPMLLKRCLRLKEQASKYGPIDGSNMAIHYMRCQKDGLNCYTSCNRYEGFDVQDWRTHIPMQPAYEVKFAALGLPERYITVNYGFERHGDAINCKAWPFERFETFVRLFRTEHPNIQVVQVGGKGFPEIPGCQHYLLGQSLELVKYVLRGAIFHLDIEGGLVHLASQLGTKCIVLFGPTPIHYYGYKENVNIAQGGCLDCCWLGRDNWICYRGLKEPECMSAIEPETVMEKADKILGSGI